MYSTRDSFKSNPDTWYLDQFEPSRMGSGCRTVNEFTTKLIDFGESYLELRGL